MRANSNRMFDFFSFSDEIKTAFAEHKPVLALESTVLTHGLPYPDNINVAKTLEDIARHHGVVPATIAILNGKIKVGLTDDEIVKLVTSQAVKASVRDLSHVIMNKQSAGTTVALTAFIAHQAGISVFATGGIGGVHYGNDLDISADLLEISRTPLTIISAGPKAILDIAKTLEVLETYSVPIIGYRTKTVPLFYSRTSQYPVPIYADSLETVISYLKTHYQFNMHSGVLIMNPIDEANEIPAKKIEPLIDQALQKAKELCISGKSITPFLLSELNQITKGESLTANIALLKNNVTLGAKIANKWNL